MSGFLITLIFSLALTRLPCAAVQSQGQNLANLGGSQTGVVAIKLFAPMYPPVARAAHIVGDVDLRLSIRQDGSIESAVAVSGHPLLRAAALDSAQHGRFECRNCSEATTSYRLVYTFQIEGVCSCWPVDSRPQPNDSDQAYPQITDATNRVTVTAQALCICDPTSDFRKRRSLKCLYLWRCGY